MKKCSKCYITKKLSEFSKDSRNTDGLKGQCKDCLKSYRRQYEKCKERREYLKEWRKSPEQKRRIKKYNQNFFKSKKGRDYMRKWRKTPKGKAKSNYDCAMRRARKKQACPDWLTKNHRSEIRQIYNKCQKISQDCGTQHHVDHIIPLANDKVCGLHVPWNLQIIEGRLNCKKNNKLTKGQKMSDVKNTKKCDFCEKPCNNEWCSAKEDE